MSVAAKVLLLALTSLALTSGGAFGRERAPAPIEFANRAERPPVSVASRSQPPVSAPARRAAAASLDMPDMLYGYGAVTRAPAQPPLDLRGVLRGGAPGDLLSEDAFEDVAPSAPEAVFAAVQTAPVAAIPQGAAVRTDGYFVQVGAFADPSNAERVRAALLDVGAVSVDVREGPTVTLHRVRLGLWASRGEAELARDMIAERGFAGAVVAAAR